MHPLSAFLVLVACKTPNTPNDTNGDGTVSVGVGPDGGVVSVGAFRLDIPAGALDEQVQISVTEVADEGPLGLAWELGPDGLQFNTPARATVSMPLEETAIETDDGFIVPDVFSVSEGTPEALANVSIDIGASFQLSADVPHFSSFVVEVGSRRVRPLIFPARDDGLSSFALTIGAVASTSVEVVVTDEGLGFEKVRGGLSAEGLTVLEHTPNIGLETGRNLISPGRVRCDANNPTASVTHTIEFFGESVLKLRLDGSCDDVEAETAAIDVQRVLGTTDGGTRFLIADPGGVQSYNPDDGEKILIGADLDPAGVFEIQPGILLATRTTGGTDQLLLKAGTEEAVLRTASAGAFQFVSVRAGEVILQEGDAYLRVAVGASIADASVVELDAADAQLLRYGERSGVVGTYADVEGDHLFEVGGGMFVSPEAGDVIEGWLWSSPLASPEATGGVPGVIEDAGRPGSLQGIPMLPLITTEPGADRPELSVVAPIRGRLHQGAVAIPDSCTEPAGAACLADGRCATACEDGSLFVSDPIDGDEDLDAFDSCGGDLWEAWDPTPGIPLDKSDAFAMIGGDDTTDHYRQRYPVPADCRNPRIGVTIAGLEESMVQLGAPFEGEGTFHTGYFEATAGEEAVVDFSVGFTGACTKYIAVGFLNCEPALDSYEYDGDETEANLIELGEGEEIVYDLSLGDKDEDWFRLDLDGTCDVEVEAVEKDGVYDVNPLTLVGHGEVALTELGSVSGGFSSTQYLAFSGAGPLYVQVFSELARVNAYDLLLRASCPFDCYTDTFEPNDSFATRDAYYDQYIGNTWGDTMTVSDADHDFWETPVSIFGCSTEPDVTFDVTILDGDPDATLMLNVTDRAGNDWVSEEAFENSKLFRAVDVLGPYPYGTDLYFEWWATGGCIEFSVEYEILCE